MYATAKSNPTAQKAQRKDLRNHATMAECLLWRLLRGRQVGGLKFRRQHGMGAFVLDFYCPELRLCIELDGGVHKTGDAMQYDSERTAFLNANGISVLRFDNEAVLQNANGIIEQILAFQQNAGKSG